MAEVCAALGTLVEGAPPILAMIVPAVTTGLGSERSMAYGVVSDGEESTLAFVEHDAFPVPSGQIHDAMQGWIRDQSRRWGLFDPARPEPKQRNRALSILSPTRLAESHNDLVDAMRRLRVSTASTMRLRDVMAATVVALGRMDAADRYQLRVLVCDGAELLAWVGAFQPEPFTGRQRRMLNALAPALQRRLTLEKHLRLAQSTALALDAALEHIPSAAYLVSSRGAVRHANAAAVLRLEGDRTGVVRALADAVRGRGPNQLDATPIAPRGGPGLWLVVERTAPRDPSPIARAAAARYRLTPREAEVLRRLLVGDSNKAIAAALGRTERTVEVHVGRVLDKLGADSRAQLIARLWASS